MGLRKKKSRIYSYFFVRNGGQDDAGMMPRKMPKMSGDIETITTTNETKRNTVQVYKIVEIDETLKYIIQGMKTWTSLVSPWERRSGGHLPISRAYSISQTPRSSASSNSTFSRHLVATLCDVRRVCRRSSTNNSSSYGDLVRIARTKTVWPQLTSARSVGRRGGQMDLWKPVPRFLSLVHGEDSLEL